MRQDDTIETERLVLRLHGLEDADACLPEGSNGLRDVLASRYADLPGSTWEIV